MIWLILLAPLFVISRQTDPASRTRELLDRLRSDQVDVREHAAQELASVGLGEQTLLKSALREERDPEVRARLEDLLRSFAAHRICEGVHPLLSPSGRRMAFQRWVEDPTALNLNGGKVWKAETWVRDLGKPREWQVASGVDAVAWRDDETLLHLSGVAVAVETGRKVSDAPPLPGLRRKNLRWSPDGREAILVPDKMFYRMNFDVDPGVDVEAGLAWVNGKGETRMVPLGHSIDSDNKGFLSWSPDGKRLAFDLLFFLKGQVPLRRIGVLELKTGKTVYVGTSNGGHQNWGLWKAEGSGYAQDWWDKKCRYFTFVAGRGHGEGEIHLATSDGAEVFRLTDDGLCKWCPVLDPAGRRIAFAAATWGGENGTLREGHLRLLDLLTGEEERFRPEEAGECSTLVWSPDGSRILYGWTAEGIRSTLYEARVSPPRAMPPDAPIVRKEPGSRKEEILNALRSENAAVVEWGIEAARDQKSPEVIAELRKTLARTLGVARWGASREAIRSLLSLDAREAAPEIFLALESKDSGTVCDAIDVASQWGLDGAQETLLRFMRDYRDQKLAVHAAAGLIIRGRTEPWRDLERLAASLNSSIRAETASLLGGLRDPHSVGILIGLVPDRARLYTDLSGDVLVGDVAERSLAVLTGETFHKDQVRWAAWWKGQDGKLPELHGPNPGLETLRIERERRTEEREKEFRSDQKK